MNTPARGSDQVIYVVTLAQGGNYRAHEILRLRDRFNSIVLVTRQGAREDDEHLVAGKYPNPTGILRLLHLRGLKRRLDKYIFFPSPHILYVTAAQRRLKDRIARDLAKGKKVCLITCLPPHDLALLGLSLKRTWPQIYWIVDWQDLWSYDENYFHRIPQIYKSRLLRLEKEILFSSDINVTTNANAKSVLERHYDVPADRVVAINHAFYPPDFDPTSVSKEKTGKRQRNEHITIGFLGTLFKPPRVPGKRVLEAIDDVVDAGVEVTLHIFGGDQEGGKRYSRKLRNPVIALHKGTNHRKALHKISACDFLLLVLSDLPNCHAVMSAKLPHYLLIGRPILAIVPERSAIADIVRCTQSGYVIPATSNWGEELTRILRDHLRGVPIPSRNEQAIEAYSWQHISAQWTKVINNAYDST